MLALPLALALAADPSFTPEAQFRPRFEADSGRDFVAGTGNVAYITHRARLGGTLALGTVEARLVFQDVRAWGEETDTRRDFDGEGIDLGIGTVTWRPHDHVALVLGRQELSIHHERLIARANWRQPGRRFDGARLAWQDDSRVAEIGAFLVVDSDAFLFATQDQVVSTPGGDQTLWFARGGRETDTMTAQATVVVDSRQEVVDAEVLRITPGAFVEGSSGIWKGHVEGYGQLGTVAGGARSVQAGMVVASGFVAPEVGTKPVIGLTYALLSGDGDPDDDVVTHFDTVRGANHRHYGNQDIATFFRGGAVGGQGLHDPFLTLAIRPMDTVQVKLDQHLFAPAAGDPWLALEPDLSAKVALHEALGLTVGASVWAQVSDPDLPLEQFAYLMLDAVLKGPKLGG